MIKVLHVVGCLERGGTEQFLMQIFRNIDRKKYSFDFYVLNPQFISNYYENEMQALGGRIIKGESFKHKNKGIKKLRYAIRAYGPFDVVHSHINLGNAYVLYAAQKEKIDVRLSHCHAVYSNNNKNWFKKIYEQFLIKILLKYATHLIACSNEAGVSLYGKKNINKIILIKNGIDYKKFLKCETSNLVNQYPILKESKCIWGNITRFDDNKNQLFILDIFKKYKDMDNNIVLVLGGYDGGYRQLVIEKAKKLGIDSSVLFIEEQDNIYEWVNVFNVFVFPSKSEGFGIALLEAECAGCKCFASTAVPKDVDIGLGIVDYIELKKTDYQWASIIYNALQTYNKPSIRVRENKIKEKGLSIIDTVEDVIKLYEN